MPCAWPAATSIIHVLRSQGNSEHDVTTAEAPCPCHEHVPYSQSTLSEFAQGSGSPKFSQLKCQQKLILPFKIIESIKTSSLVSHTSLAGSGIDGNVKLFK